MQVADFAFKMGEQFVARQLTETLKQCLCIISQSLNAECVIKGNEQSQLFLENEKTRG